MSTDLHSFVGHEGDTYPKGVDPAFVLGMLIRTSMWWLTQLVSECYVGFGSQVSIPDRMRYLTLALKAAPGLNPGRPMVGIYCPGTQYAMLGWPLGARTYLAPNWGNNNSLFLCFCIEAVQEVPPILCLYRRCTGSTANPMLSTLVADILLLSYALIRPPCSACLMLSSDFTIGKEDVNRSTVLLSHGHHLPSDFAVQPFGRPYCLSSLDSRSPVDPLWEFWEQPYVMTSNRILTTQARGMSPEPVQL